MKYTQLIILRNQGLIKIISFFLMSFFLFSCSSKDKKFEKEITDIIKLESNSNMIESRGYNKSGNLDGPTNLSLYLNDDNNIESKVYNQTGSVYQGYESWDDTYVLEYDDMFRYKKSNYFGIGGKISKSQKGTTDVSYNIKFYDSDTTLYVGFFGDNWSQSDKFSLQNPDSVRIHVQRMFELSKK